jgi:lysophospholipase L1-like esterase
MGEEGERLSTGQKWGLLVAVTGVVLFAVLAVAEWAIRERQARLHGTAATAEQLYVLDEKIDLRVPIANLTAGPIRTNSLGFRGPEIRVPKPDNTVRIAFLGASTTWCAEVSSNEKTWPHLVTERLRETVPGTAVDYVNGGVPGYVVRSSLRNLAHRVAPLQPDIIVIYHATNDMSAELRELAASKGVWQRKAVESRSWLSERSLLWNLAEKNLRILIAQKKVEADVGRLDVDERVLGETFRKDLEALVRAAQQHAKVVAIATFSTRLRPGQSPEEQLEASASALYYMPFMTPEGLLRSYARYNDVIREVARSRGAVLIEGEDQIPGDPAHFADSVHFNDAGASAMAQRVAGALLSEAAVQSLLQPSHAR